MSFPRYPSYRESGIDWFDTIPVHWGLERLRHLVTLNPSKSEIAGLPDDTEVTFLPMEAIGETGEIDVARTRPLAELKNGYTYFADGDLVFAKVTPCFENGKGALIEGLLGGSGFGTTELTVLRPHAAADAQFLRWLIFSDLFRGPGSGEMLGAGGLKRVPDGFVADFPVPWPSPSERQTISAFLNRETAKIDALVEEQRRLVELLKEKRQAVISHAVTKGLDRTAPMKSSGVEWLGEVPAHWTVAAVDRRYDVQLGQMLNEERSQGEHLRPYLRVFDVQWDSINTDDLPFMNFLPAAQQRYRLEPGDLLVNEGGSYVGRSAIWRGDIEECYYQKALHRLRAHDPSADTAEFFLFVMEMATQIGVFIAQGNQTTIDHLTAEQFRATKFAFPPAEEQLQIAGALREATKKSTALIRTAKNAAALLSERRAALISAAVTGKIDVRSTTNRAKAA